jgi:peptidoglycan/LPS O-acetylase OafA/YrhL
VSDPAQTIAAGEAAPAPAESSARLPSLAQVFDPRRNGLNFIRLMLATAVIVWHSGAVTGHTVTWGPVRKVGDSIWVDGFFAISGFLITRSWLSRPHLGQFMRARALRILPAFWCCLFITAFVIAPLAVRAQGQSIATSDSWHYVVSNFFLKIHSYDIAGTPTDVPYPAVWNGSLWTLWWEALCYVGVAVVGVLGLLGRYRRQVVCVAWVGCWLVGLAVELGVLHRYDLRVGARFGLMFASGALLLVFADRVPVSRRLVALAALAIVPAAFLPEYRMAAAPFVAYVAVVGGALLKGSRWNFKQDISYGTYVYAFPLQQTLACVGLATLPVPVFALLSVAVTLPVAAASWFVVERPALRLKGRSRPPVLASPSVGGGS